MLLLLRQARRRIGFTLVELLVAMAVLSIMLIGIATAIGLVSRLWQAGVGTTDNFTKAHVVLNLLDRDIQMMVLRRDLPAFVSSSGTALDSNGNPICAFYTNIQGSPGTDSRALSLVQYLLTVPPSPTSVTGTATLTRLNYGMNFSTTTPAVGSTTALPAFSSTSTGTDTVFTGIVRFEIQFVDGTGTLLIPPYIPTNSTGTTTGPFTYDFINPGDSSNPRAVVVSMLVLSNSAYTLATANGGATLNKLLADFPVGTSTALPTGMTSTMINGNTYPTETYAQYWNSIFNPASGTLDPTLPAPIRSGIQVFERHIPLPITTPSS